MANFHSDKWIMDKVYEHLNEARQYFSDNHIVGIFCQGSQNYGLDYENSDIDTKLITTPTLDDLIFNKAPVSTTHARENDEHIDFKDIRLYMQTFRKQNLNFLEILFTPYCYINPEYKKIWNILIEHREEITHYSPIRAMKSMRGIALEKYHAMEHRYPSKIAVIDEYGYDPKQLHHLLRVEEYMSRYIAGESYADCLISNKADYLKEVKSGKYNLEEAREIADATLVTIEDKYNQFISTDQNENLEVEKYLDDVQAKIVRKSILEDFTKEGKI